MKTHDYSQFVYRQGNRRISEGHIKRLINEIQDIGYVKSRPVMVTKNMEIIDGQHRFEACKRLGLPIYYEIEDGDIDKIMLSLNRSQSIWRLQDYVDHYASKGLECYQTIVQFEKEFKLGISNNLTIINGGSVPVKKIKDGELIQVNRKYIEIAKYILKCKEYLPFYKNKKFVEAVTFLFARANDKDRDRLLKKIGIVQQQVNSSDYLRIFENLINKNRQIKNKISLI